MPSYTYRGRDGGGQEVRGKLDAPSRDDAARSLMGMGVTPLEIAEATAAAGFEIRLQGLFEEKPKHEDILLFFRQLHSLLKAGVPIMRALTGLQESAINPGMKKVLQDLRESLDSGRELSAAMARHPKVFTAFSINMVRVGEMTGMLEEIFLRLFHHMEFERFMRDQVKSALRYPSFVIAAMAVALVVINIWVIPAFAKVFAGFGSELPLMTRVLIGFSDFMVANWAYLLLALVGAVFGFRSWVGTRRGRYDWDRIKLKIPIAGKIVLKATLARFARSFALASRSGVPVIQALSNVAQTVDNAFVADRIERMRDGVERGESVLRTSIAAGIFTPVVIQMIAVGEEAGSLDDMLQEIADMYQREVEYELKTLSQQIEPILIVFLGIMVLILALGIFLPMWDLGSAVKGRQG
ncbi:type II secretion system F family protein [Azovibrio restrictus]|uniref:type II secretion system F family protein n=1 Tax=Azovibrio restrictus TaxID=146938 RepID=UPI0026F1605A|nr:type II secretion system F family protein [Azovibrio restrictus]